MRPANLLLASCLAMGCAGQNSQLATCQAEKEQLLATIRTQRDTAQALHEQVASLETRLDQAEKHLASSSSATRISSRPPPAAPTTRKAAPATTKAEPLPWRAPAAKPSSTAPASTASPPASGQRAANARATLLELAKRERTMNYDAAAAAARIELPLEFREGGAELSAADKTRLDEVSRLLRSEGARDLPIVVAGANRQRAQAVADYLDRHGIAGDRLLVSAGPPRGVRGASQGVSIYLAGDESPLVAEARSQAVTR